MLSCACIPVPCYWGTEYTTIALTTSIFNRRTTACLPSSFCSVAQLLLAGAETAVAAVGHPLDTVLSFVRSPARPRTRTRRRAHTHILPTQRNRHWLVSGSVSRSLSLSLCLWNLCVYPPCVVGRVCVLCICVIYGHLVLPKYLFIIHPFLLCVYVFADVPSVRICACILVCVYVCKQWMLACECMAYQLYNVRGGRKSASSELRSRYM